MACRRSLIIFHLQGGRVHHPLWCHLRGLQHSEAIPQRLGQVCIPGTSLSNPISIRRCPELAVLSQWFKDHIESDDVKPAKPAAVRKPSAPLKSNGSIGNVARTPPVAVNVSNGDSLLNENEGLIRGLAGAKRCRTQKEEKSSVRALHGIYFRLPRAMKIRTKVGNFD